MLDEDGFLYMLDRLKDVIITGGSNIFPAEVEAVLAAHPSVALVSVVAVPDAVKGELAVGCIVAQEEAERIRRRAAGLLQGAPGVLQGSAPDRLLRQIPFGSDRKDPQEGNRGKPFARAGRGASGFRPDPVTQGAGVEMRWRIARGKIGDGAAAVSRPRSRPARARARRSSGAAFQGSASLR